MNKTRAGFFFALVLFGFVLPAWAIDFGLVVQQSPEFTNTGNEEDGEWNYTGSYSPWLSSEWGTTAKLYLSAKISTVYKNGEWRPENHFLFEPGRFEIAWRPRSYMYLEAGRVSFQDPLGIIASGLFDGFNGSVVLGKARISAGAFYTGLLYKETAKIVMSFSDAENYAKPFDPDDMDTYFASRRLMFSATGEFADLTPRVSLALNALAQFDVNPDSVDETSALHTQYFTAQLSYLPLETLTLTGTGVAALAEDHDKDAYGHFAFAAALDWEVPGALQDMAEGELRWASGAAADDNILAFAPVSAHAQGQVFSPRLSGLMTLKWKYTARVHRSFSVNAEGTYFIKTDDGTLVGSDYPASSKRLLGGELYGSLLCAPVSDILITVGAGVFLPGMGDAFVSDAPNRWKVSAGLVLSL